MLLFSIPPIAHVWLLDLKPGNARAITQTPGISSSQELVRPSLRQMLVSVFSYFFQLVVIMCDTLMVDL